MDELITNLLQDRRFIPRQSKYLVLALNFKFIRLKENGYYEVTRLGKSFLTWNKCWHKLVEFL